MTTLYDERSAGGLVFRRQEGKILWLVIHFAGTKRINRENDHLNASSKTVYKFPKGHLLKGEFLKKAALREVEEEGRIKAKIITKLGSNNYIIWDKLTRKRIVKKVTFFLMEYQSESSLRHFDPEMVLDRFWFDYNTAMEKLGYDSEKKLLTKAKKKVELMLK